MSSTSVRNKIHQIIDTIDDKEYLKTIHVLLKDKSDRMINYISDSELLLLEKRSAKAKKNISKLKNWKEIKSVLNNV